MAERTIVGVDFSGAEDDRDTWVAQGLLTDYGSIRFRCALPTRREDLYHLLTEIMPPAIVALDFPFGVAEEDAKRFDAKATKMCHVWRKLSTMDSGQVPRNNLKRRSDKRFPGSLPPLNVRMYIMTHGGMKMLHELHENHPDRWYVPPLELTGEESDKVTLLEVMPGAVLERVGFERAVAKGYKKAKDAFANRDLIISELEDKAGIGIENFSAVSIGCRANDDCLDSVVALVAAALWAHNRSRFDCPEDNDELAKLEGWIYAPKE